MTDETSATEHEQEQGPERLDAEEEMRGPNSADPDLPGSNDSDDEDE